MAETTMQIGDRRVQVVRPHTPAASPLRAWSAADVLALEHLLEASDAATLGRLLVVNDEFGALTCALVDHAPTLWSDSVLSRNAVIDNLARNHAGANTLAEIGDRIVSGDAVPPGEFDTIVVRVPKSIALLEHQLRTIRRISAPDARVIGAAMVRHQSRATIEAFETLVGPTVTSRAVRKARLIHSTPDHLAAPSEPRPRNQFVANHGSVIVELPGVFSAGHVDVGSALLIDLLRQQPAAAAGSVVLDLGCGNGVVAAELAPVWSQSGFELVDVSDLAVASARATWAENRLENPMTAYVDDGLGSRPDDSVDVVVTNPPFHQGHALDEALTDRLMADTARVLRPEGRAYVVAQRHLRMHTRLRQWFGSVEVLSQHPSHVVLQLRSPR